jgi:four helix bundle protein
MDEVQNKKYDLADRTLRFAKDVRIFVKDLQRTIGNIEDGKQLIRSSGSVGANYIEACECLSKKDFLMRIKISRKEAKETIYWLNLIYCEESQFKERDRLIQECTELMKIFGSIVFKS